MTKLPMHLLVVLSLCLSTQALGFEELVVPTTRAAFDLLPTQKIQKVLSHVPEFTELWKPIAVISAVVAAYKIVTYSDSTSKKLSETTSDDKRTEQHQITSVAFTKEGAVEAFNKASDRIFNQFNGARTIVGRSRIGHVGNHVMKLARSGLAYVCKLNVEYTMTKRPNGDSWNVQVKTSASSPELIRAQSAQ